MLAIFMVLFHLNHFITEVWDIAAADVERLK